MKDTLIDIIAKYHSSGIEQLPDFDQKWSRILIEHSAALSDQSRVGPNCLTFDAREPSDSKRPDAITIASLTAAYLKMKEYARSHVEIDINKLCQLAGIVNSTESTDKNCSVCEFRAEELPDGAGGLGHVPAKNIESIIKRLCDDINDYRRQISLKSTRDYYNFTFDTQRLMIYVSPWRSGNARMARLVTNWMQYEYGLLCTRVDANDAKAYIQAYRDSMLQNNPEIFRQYLSEAMCVHLSDDLKAYSLYMQSLPRPTKKPEVKKRRDRLHGPLIINPLKTRGKILQLLIDNPKLSAAAISKVIGISTKGIERHFSRLKHDGYLRRIGPDKGGHWEVDFSGNANNDDRTY